MNDTQDKRLKWFGGALAIAAVGGAVAEVVGIPVARFVTPWGWLFLAGAVTWAFGPALRGVVRAIEAFGVRVELSKDVKRAAEGVSELRSEAKAQGEMLSQMSQVLSQMAVSTSQRVQMTTGIDQDRFERIVFALTNASKDVESRSDHLVPPGNRKARFPAKDIERRSGREVDRGGTYISGYLPQHLDKLNDLEGSHAENEELSPGGDLARRTD